MRHNQIKRLTEIQQRIEDIDSLKINDASLVMITNPDCQKKSKLALINEPLTQRKLGVPFLFGGLKSSFKMQDVTASSGRGTPNYNYALPQPASNLFFSPRVLEKKVVIKPGGFIRNGFKTPNPSRQFQSVKQKSQIFSKQLPEHVAPYDSANFGTCLSSAEFAKRADLPSDVSYCFSPLNSRVQTHQAQRPHKSVEKTMSKTGGFEIGRRSEPFDFDMSRMSYKKRYHQELMPSITRNRMFPSRNERVQPIQRNIQSNMTDFRKSKLSLMEHTGNFLTINNKKNFIGDLDPSQFKLGPQSSKNKSVIIEHQKNEQKPPKSPSHLSLPREQSLHAISKQGSIQVLNNEMDICKARNSQIFDDICLKISHLVYQNSSHSKLEPNKSVTLNLPRISVIYLKLDLNRKQAPLRLFLNNNDSDISVFYSFNNPYPCEGQLGKENDGSFININPMVIGNGPDKRFSQKQIYIGIYTRKGVKDQLMCQFGKFEKVSFGEKIEKQARPVNTKIFSKQKRLQIFQTKTYDEIQTKIYKQFEQPTSLVEEPKEKIIKLVKPKMDFNEIKLNRRQTYLESQTLKKEMQLTQIKDLHIQKYKYNIFLTIKQGILKNIKNQQLDELIAVLRKRKFAKVWLYNRVKDLVIKRLKSNIDELRERKIHKLRLRFGAIKIINRVSKKLRKINGLKSTVQERIQKSQLIPAFKMLAFTNHQNNIVSSKALIKKFLSDNMEYLQLYISSSKYHHKLMSMIIRLRYIANRKIKLINLIKENILTTRKIIIDKIMLNKAARQQFDWLLNGFNIPKEAIEQVCQQFYDYCRSITWLDQMRWTMLYRQDQTITIGQVSKHIEMFKKAKNSFILSYIDELRDKYPSDFSAFVTQNGQIEKMSAKKGKKIKIGPKSPDKEVEIQSPAKKKSSKGKKSLKKGQKEEQETEMFEIQDNLDQKCFFFQMDKFYQEFDIPKREDLDQDKPPTLDFNIILQSAQVEIPSTKAISPDLDGVLNEEIPPFVQENPWCLNIHSILYSCIIQSQRNQH